MSGAERGADAEPPPGFAETPAASFRSVPDAVLSQEVFREMDRLRRQLAEARAEVARLERLVEQDALLPVLNRRGFDRALERAIAYVDRYQARATLIYIDLDGFKAVNDDHGHAAGDALLTRVARTLVDSLRRSDVIARLGGDEFAALLWNADEEQTADKARQLCERIAAIELDIGGGKTIRAGASAGYTVLGGRDSVHAAMARADAAMYARKRKSKGQIRR